MITYQRLAWKLTPRITSEAEDRRDFLWLAQHCALAEARRRAWRMVEILDAEPGREATQLWQAFRDTAHALVVDGRCPADPLAIRYAVLLSRWTIHHSKPRALRYAQLAYAALGELHLDLWTASKLRPMVYSQLAKCLTVTGGDGELLARRALAELRTSTGKRIHAQTLLLVASVLRFKDRATAIASAREAAELWDAAGDAHEKGRVLLLLADLLEEDGEELDEAMAVIADALAYLDRWRDDWLWQVTHLNKVHFELVAGHLEAAKATLDAMPSFRCAATDLHRRWIIARYELCAGNGTRAARELRAVAEEYERQDRKDLQHLALIDLAVALQRDGEAHASRQLAQKVRAFFEVEGEPPRYLTLTEQIEANRSISLPALRQLWRRSILA